MEDENESLGIGAKEATSIEVNQVGWIAGAPYLRFPGDYGQKFPHHVSPVGKCCNKNQPCLASFE
jgi:hypothetical protein